MGDRYESDPRIPEKEYFRIGEVAQIAGVESHVLRFWESEFGRLRPAKTRSGQRVYSRRDVSLVLRIRDLLYEEGFTILGARRQLQRGRYNQRDQTPPAEAVPARTRAVLARVRKEVEDLLRLVGE
jgi:DNA-binding transcriptional MerR regulator